ncbi:putative ent-copalyl diphosphate synthase [Helianthus anomalus]
MGGCRMENISNNQYLEMAKLDYNQCQTIHQLEWTNIQKYVNSYSAFDLWYFILLVFRVKDNFSLYGLYLFSHTDPICQFRPFQIPWLSIV